MTCFALRALVDVVADRDNDAGLPRARAVISARASLEQIVAAVNVGNDVSQAHGAAHSRRGMRGS